MLFTRNFTLSSGIMTPFYKYLKVPRSRFKGAIYKIQIIRFQGKKNLLCTELVA